MNIRLVSVKNSYQHFANLLALAFGLKTPYPRIYSGYYCNWLRSAVKNRGRRKRKTILVAGLIGNSWDQHMIYIAIALYMLGYDIILVLNSDVSKKQIISLKLCLRKLFPKAEKKDFVLVTLGESKKWRKEDGLDERQAGIFSDFNTIYRFCVEERSDNPEQKMYFEFLKKKYSEWKWFFRELLAESAVYRIISPSGVLLHSWPLLEVAQEKGVTNVTIESWAGRGTSMFIYGINESAFTGYDMLRCSKLFDWDDEKEKWLGEYCEKQEDIGSERYPKFSFKQYQKVSINAKWPDSFSRFMNSQRKKVLLATNVIGDSATIHRATLFGGQKDWIREVIRYFEKRGDTQLIIRPHPAEAGGNTAVKLGGYAKSLVRDRDLVYVIQGDEDINSYSLISHIECALTWVSTITADIVIRNKAVILAGNAVFNKFKFAILPYTKEAYFKLIDSYLNERPIVDEEQILNAKKYLYISQNKRVVEFDKSNYDLSLWKLPNEYDETDAEKYKYLGILSGELDEFGSKHADVGSL